MDVRRAAARSAGRRRASGRAMAGVPMRSLPTTPPPPVRLLAPPPAAAAGVPLPPATGATFPQRSYLLTLPSKVQLVPSQVSVTENGAPVQALTVTPASVVGESHFGTVLLIETSQSMQGSAIQAAMGAARSFAANRNPQQPLAVSMFGSDSTAALPFTTDPARIGPV